MRHAFLHSAVLSALALLAACGGGGGDSAPPSTGRLVDAPVSNMAYRTASQSGSTDVQGRFNFAPGETVTFNTGTVSLPAVLAGALLTPVDMGAAKTLNDPATLAIAQLLQGLDGNNNPADGIAIDASRLRTNATTPNWAAGPDVGGLFNNASLVPSKEKALMALANGIAAESAEAKATLVGRFTTGAAAGVAEIIAYHAASQSAFITVDNTANPSAFRRVALNGLPSTALTNPTSAGNLTGGALVSVTPDVNDVNFTAGCVQTMDISGNLLAIAVANTNKVRPGVIAFYRIAADGSTSFIKKVTVGALPDGIAFSPDGSRLVVANEGELPVGFNPSSTDTNLSTDPEGSISVISISAGVPADTAVQLNFIDFNVGGSRSNEVPANFRIGRAGATLAQDAEPEFVGFSEDGREAYVTLQENNAVAVVNLTGAPTISSLQALGFKDHGLAKNALTLSDQATQTRPAVLKSVPNLLGVYMPDGVAGFGVGSQRFYITANEGDDRGDFGIAETARLSGLNLDPTAFPNGAALKANSEAGRLTILTRTGTGLFGDTDGDNDYDRLYVLGSRSFSIWNASTGAQVYDSASELEALVYAEADQDTANANELFTNSNGLVQRYDNKGPEPEGVAVGVVKGKRYAFIGLERAGSVVMYNIDDPTKPRFVQLLRNTTNLNNVGDVSPEGLKFVPASQSPNGKALLLVGYEVSGTLAVYTLD